jgi:hypothetical protein
VDRHPAKMRPFVMLNVTRKQRIVMLPMELHAMMEYGAMEWNIVMEMEIV